MSQPPAIRGYTFKSTGGIYLSRCPRCGLENYAMNVSSGCCYACRFNANTTMIVYTTTIDEQPCEPARTGIGLGFADITTQRNNTLIGEGFVGFCYALEVEGEITQLEHGLLLFDAAHITHCRRLQEYDIYPPAK